ncbi:unnamed protein product [Clonostachys rosea]|uniref:Uncharacterized protein n=1 Tax=Bionectria ochroleuca TaxID=29856 RepID=A0ABY6U0R3_BIOOC|nr:unnamed protein product [Clonostachys rosea]
MVDQRIEGHTTYSFREQSCVLGSQLSSVGQAEEIELGSVESASYKLVVFGNVYGVEMVYQRATFTEASTIVDKGVISGRVIDKGWDSFIVDVRVTLHWRVQTYTTRIKPDNFTSLPERGGETKA